MSDIVIYIISQICIILALLLQGSTFLVFNRNNQLSLNIATNILYAISFGLLGGYVAVAMGVIAVGRDSVRNALNKLENSGKIKPSRRRDFWMLIFWMLLFTIGCALTASGGVLSILPYFSTMLFTIAIWQSNFLFYRISGIFTNAIMIVYNVFLFNIMGILLQVAMTLFAIVGVVSYFVQRAHATHNK